MSTSSDVYSEEPYALIGHVRFCEGEVRAQNGAHPLYSTSAAVLMCARHGHVSNG